MRNLLIVGGSVPHSALSAPPSHRFHTPPTGPQNAGTAGYSHQNFFLAHGKIIASESAEETQRVTSGTSTLTAEGCTILPGFIDVHVHGGMGHDTMDATPEAIGHITRFHAEHGTTALLPTTMTAPADETLAAVEAVAAFLTSSRKGQSANDAGNRSGHKSGDTAAEETGAHVLGVHLEGPFISPQFPGAQPAQHIRPPDLAEFERLVAAGPLRMMTLAPEQPGALALIDAAARHGVVTVLGHTMASYAECQAAAERGLAQATHTYNAMRGLHHREPGALGAVLNDDRIDAQLIADNIHVHPAAMNILVRCKGVERTLLITDAMRAAGLPPGEYTLGGQAVTMQNGECRLADGTLAGSVLTMERALKNFLAATELPLDQAWPVSSYVPARTLGLHHERGHLAVGCVADLVLLDDELDVMATLVGGQIAYLRDPERLVCREH